QPGDCTFGDLPPLSPTKRQGITGKEVEGQDRMNLQLANRPQDNRPPAYAALERLVHRWTSLKDGRAVLDWDTAVMMPGGGAEARSEQIAALDLACHGILSGPATGDLLDGPEDAKAELDPWQRANLAEMRRLWIHGTALEPDLV